MELAITHHDDIAVVEISGEIVDGQPAEQLQDALRNLVQENKADIIIDLSNVKWFDSVAIGIIVSHYVSVTRLKGRILLMGASDRIKTMMKMARLADRFGWADDRKEAFSWFKR